MTFLWPDALWLLAALPALAVAYVASCRRRNPQPLRYMALMLVREAVAAPQWLRRHGPPLLFLAGLAAALLAAARPAALATAQAESGTVILAIDVSLSMAATDVAPSRLAAAQAAMADFVRAQPRNVRVGIVAFGGSAHVVQPPTTDREAVLATLERLHLQPYTGIGTGVIASVLALHPAAGVSGGDDIYEKGWEASAPRAAMLGPFQPAEKSRKRIAAATDFSSAIILVSDGCGTIGVSPVKAAEAAAKLGLRVYTVGVGTPYGGTAHLEGLPAIHGEFQEEVLREVARITGGEYFHARNAGRLATIYGRLTRKAVMEKTEITLPLTALGMALLVAAAVLSLLWWSRMPVGRPQA